jgi:hypothetical protein
MPRSGGSRRRPDAGARHEILPNRFISATNLLGRVPNPPSVKDRGIEIRPKAKSFARDRRRADGGYLRSAIQISPRLALGMRGLFFFVVEGEESF